MHPRVVPDGALGLSPSQRGAEPPAEPPPAPPLQPPSAQATVAPQTPAAGPRPPRADDRARASAAALPQLGSGRVVGGAVAVTAGVVAFDLWVTGRLSMFFDLSFVLVSLSAALTVRRRGLFAVAVLAPLLLGGVVALLGLAVPHALTASSLPFASTWLTGLANHGAALAASQAVALAVVGMRAAQTPAASAGGR